MKGKKIVSILIVLIIAVLAFALFKKFHAPALPQGQLSDSEIKSLVNKVSKLINVPDETPVIATILKADELTAEQKFYAGSKDGDYLIVFPQNQKAIIYREKENRLINVGPIIVDQTATSTKPAASTTASSTVDAKRSATSTDTSHDIINGSSTKKSN